MALRVLSRAQETLLNKESPTFKNLMVGTSLKHAQEVINNRVSMGIADGVNADEVDISDLDPEITEIVAIFAITSATGAPASKFLLEETTDYTFEDGVLETVTDQSANTLIIVYK
jgi:hypothetical protein